MSNRGEEISGRLQYNTDLFDATTIERMLGHFQILLAGIVANPEQRISDLPLLSEAREASSFGGVERDTRENIPRTSVFMSCLKRRQRKRPTPSPWSSKSSSLPTESSTAGPTNWRIA